jgi:hypothetical protein
MNERDGIRNHRYLGQIDRGNRSAICGNKRKVWENLIGCKHDEFR